ncbi:unnamed protein product [Symbiodinium sp. CCMP2592]|nr:unnamed protein product [Symbiodinium sp. CCMP2592]
MLASPVAVCALGCRLEWRRPGRPLPSRPRLALHSVPWRHKELATEKIADAAGCLADGNFAQAAASALAVLALASGWKPARAPHLAAAPPPVADSAFEGALSSCPLTLQALRLRLLARLQLRAFEGARADARALSRAASLRVRGGAERWRDYLALARLAEAAAEVGLGSYEAAQDLLREDLGFPSTSQLAAAWRRVDRQAKCFQRLSEGGFSEMSPVYFVEDDEGGELDEEGVAGVAAEVEEASWHVAVSLPAFPDYVCEDLKVSLAPNGQRGVVAAADIPRGTLLMAANAAVFQGPSAFPAPPTAIGARPGRASAAPARLVKAFPDPTAPMQKALSTTLAASGKARRGVGLLSTGEVQPAVGRDVLQGLSAAEAESPGRQLGAEQLFGVLKTNAFSCASHGWGLWVSIAFVNHACCPNAQYVITEKEEGSVSSARGGGLMLLRAAKDLSKGDEVTFEYFGTAHAVRSYRGRQEISQNHGALGFTCNCPRCAFENRSREEPFFQELRRLLPQLEALDSEDSAARLEEFSRIVEKLEHLVSSLPLDWTVDTFVDEPPGVRRTIEPAWHRRQRKARTRARTLLRAVGSGWIEASQHRLQAAQRLVYDHHSTMAASAAWHCRSCKQSVRGTFAYCPSCGQHWSATGTYANQPQHAPWPHKDDHAWGQQEPWTSRQDPRARSPRSRKAKSPRSRGQPDKGGGKGKTKGPKGQPASKGAGTSVPPERSLPAAPVPAIPPPPKEGTTSNGLTASDHLLQQLIGAMSRTREELPQQLRSLLDEHTGEDHKTAGRAMHKLVSAQTAARRELDQIKAARRDFLAQWTKYTTKLCQTWEQQLQEKATAMQEFDQSEERWSQQLQETSRDISKLNGEVQQVDGSDSEDMNTADQAIDEEIQREQQRRQFQEQMAVREAEISRTLQAACQASKEQEAFLERPDRERSPRRRAEQPPGKGKQDVKMDAKTEVKQEKPEGATGGGATSGQQHPA